MSEPRVVLTDQHGNDLLFWAMPIHQPGDTIRVPLPDGVRLDLDGLIDRRLAGPGCWVSQGESAVAMRRMDALKTEIVRMTIRRVDTQALQRGYDQVHRALTKAFGLPR